MRRLIAFAIITVMTVIAAACGGAATNNSNATANNASANNAANANTNANSRREDEMPMMNGDHQRMGEQHRGQGMNMENRQMQHEMRNSGSPNVNK